VTGVHLCIGRLGNSFTGGSLICHVSSTLETQGAT
jgi:hypothetical protein